MGFNATVFFCPVFLRRYDCALRQRGFNHSRLVRPLCICWAWRHGSSLAKHRSSGPSSRSSPHFLVISHHRAGQLLGILLTKTALSHPSDSHLAPPLILLAVVFTSACNVLIIDKVPFPPPFARIGTDGGGRFIIAMRQP